MSTTKSTCKNVLLIDNAVPEAQLFFNAVNADTFPIFYSYNTTRAELLAILEQNFITIDRLGLVFTTEGSGRPKPFLEQSPFFTAAETATATSSPYSANVEFIISILRQFQIKNIDYLACATLTYPEWNNYYAILSRETTVIVGASNDNTGNLQYGGDWIMESTSEDIEFIYFTESIEYYTHLLDTAAASSIVLKGTTIFGTGYNQEGGLGINTISNVGVLTAVPAPNTPAGTPKYITCSAGFSLVLMTNGTLYGSGRNGSGQLGIGNNTDVRVFTQLTTMPVGKTPTYITTGAAFLIVLMNDGTIYGSGLNTTGQLGKGDLSNCNVLTRIPVGYMPVGKTPKYVNCGSNFTVVLMMDGTIYGTGGNQVGQLGKGDLSDCTVLTPMTNMPNDKIPQLIACGGESITDHHTMVLMTDGTIYGTGGNDFGQLGKGDTSNCSVLTPMTNMPANKTPSFISCGQWSTIVLMTDGTIYCTGRNNYGQLGTGNYTNYNILTLMTNTTGKTPISISALRSSTVVLMTDGAIYGTGENYYGELGRTATPTTVNLLTQFNSGTGVTYLMNGYDPVLPCFKKDTKILTNRGYILIQDLRKGDYVQTFRHGHQPIEKIGYSTINHNAISDRRKDQLYVCANKEYPDVFEDLVLTGSHAILVDEFTDDQQRNETKEVLTDIFLTDNYFRLPACVDARTRVYDQPGTYTIYHLALQHENYYMNYGIYANGLLVESCSMRYMKEYSCMRFVE